MKACINCGYSHRTDCITHLKRRIHRLEIELSKAEGAKRWMGEELTRLYGKPKGDFQRTDALTR